MSLPAESQDCNSPEAAERKSMGFFPDGSHTPPAEEMDAVAIDVSDEEIESKPEGEALLGDGLGMIGPMMPREPNHHNTAKPKL